MGWTCPLSKERSCHVVSPRRRYCPWLWQLSTYTKAAASPPYLLLTCFKLALHPASIKPLKSLFMLLSPSPSRAKPVGGPALQVVPTRESRQLVLFVMKAFAAMVEPLPRQLWPAQHWIGVGNNNRIQNRLRALQGSLLLYGPKSKPTMDHNSKREKASTPASSWTSADGSNRQMAVALSGTLGWKKLSARARSARATTPRIQCQTLWSSTPHQYKSSSISAI